jgi:ubiquinone/menaquinone biosynthesis C-methylase UbiE
LGVHCVDRGGKAEPAIDPQSRAVAQVSPSPPAEARFLSGSGGKRVASPDLEGPACHAQIRAVKWQDQCRVHPHNAHAVTSPATPDDVIAFYSSGRELDRLLLREGMLEFERTKQLIRRFLEPGSSVADVGGGTGRHAEWLVEEGHHVELVEAAPALAELARGRAGEPPSFRVSVADARALPFATESFDAVLLFGPLYHLGEEQDRLAALKEAGRVCRPGGVVFAIAISRFALLLTHIRRGDIGGPRVFANVMTELQTGRRVRPAGRASSFPDAYFHLPAELRTELQKAGLDVVALLGIEGPGWMARGFDNLWNDTPKRERLLEIAAVAEAEPHLVAMSLHLMAVAKRP